MGGDAVTTFLGVDCGLDGAFACITQDGVASFLPMPIIKSGIGRGRVSYDIPEVLAWLRRKGKEDWIGFAICEKLHAMPMAHGGVIANYSRGRALMLAECALTACEIPYELVSARVWMKAMHAGVEGATTKQRSILAAKRLFPGLPLRRTPLCTKDHDGIAEALLLAEYGRRVHGAVAV